MSVYVDRARNGFGRLVMSHMIADTPDELHAMADRIDVARRWFQTPPKASFWHYDIAQTKRARAHRWCARLRSQHVRYAPVPDP